MKLFGLLGAASYCAVAIVVGVRLLLLARRTGKLPELLVGIAFLCGSSLGYTGLVAAEQVIETAPLASHTLFLAGWTGLVVAALCLLLFWERLYHRGQPAARALAAAAAALLVGSQIGLMASVAPGTDPAASLWYPVGFIGQGFVYGLNSWSGWRYHRMLRRRLPLGLADPVVVNRILLWSVAASSVALQYTFSTTRLVLSGQSPASESSAAAIAPAGILAAAAMLLAFLPPRFYLRRFEPSRAGARG